MQVAVELFVESDDRVDRRAAVRARQSGGEFGRRQRDLAHAALDEISGQRRFGELHHLRARLERGRLREHLADAAQVALNVPFPRTELGDSDVQKRHRPKVRAPDG